MSRLDRFRESRRTKKKYVFAFSIFFSIILCGLCISDYSINNVMKNEKQVGLVLLKKVNSSHVEINFMNKKIYVNTMYIDRDLYNLEKWFTRAHGGKLSH